MENGQLTSKGGQASQPLLKTHFITFQFSIFNSTLIILFSFTLLYQLVGIDAHHPAFFTDQTSGKI